MYIFAHSQTHSHLQIQLEKHLSIWICFQKQPPKAQYTDTFQFTEPNSDTHQYTELHLDIFQLQIFIKTHSHKQIRILPHSNHQIHLQTQSR